MKKQTISPNDIQITIHDLGDPSGNFEIRAELRICSSLRISRLELLRDPDTSVQVSKPEPHRTMVSGMALRFAEDRLRHMILKQIYGDVWEIAWQATHSFHSALPDTIRAPLLGEHPSVRLLRVLTNIGLENTM